MFRTHFCTVFGLLSVSIVPSAVFAQEGTLVWDQITSPALEGNLIGDSATRRLAVYLPPSYETSDKRYPVFYYLSGYTVNFQGVQSYSRNVLKRTVGRMMSRRTTCTA